jgi:acetate kinase
VNVLVLNAGSWSLKYVLHRAGSWERLAAGAVEGVGGRGRHRHRAGARAEEAELDVPDHAAALARVVEALDRTGWDGAAGPDAVGHRVVHGGERFSAPAVVDDEVLSAIRATVPLAPLHNPPALLGIELARARWPAVPQVAVFDTAFHQTLPARAHRYAVPVALHGRHGVRRYGFHGTSHAYVARRAAELLGRPLERLALVTLHLGNGASAAAIRGGRSVDTSMGMTPLEGLVMATRAGDVDPGVVFHLARSAGMSLEAIEDLLVFRSGLLGLAGEADMREVLRRAARGDPDAALAVDVYAYRIVKYVGAYHAVLGGLDALVFTAGVGENSAEIRERVCDGLAHLGIALDPARNRSSSREARAVHREGGPVAVLVVPTDEELEIARQTVESLAPAR